MKISNRKFISGWLITLSTLIFAAIIPFVQKQLDDVQERRMIHAANVFRGDIYNLGATFYYDVGRSMDMLSNESQFKVISEIKNGIVPNRVETFWNKYVSLTTFPIGLDKDPEKSRQFEARIKKEYSNVGIHDGIWQEEQKITADLTREDSTFTILLWLCYVVAVVFQVLGFWIGFMIKDVSQGEDQVLTEVRQVRGLIDRILHRLKE